MNGETLVQKYRKAIASYYAEVEKVDRCRRLNLRHKDKRDLIKVKVAKLKKQLDQQAKGVVIKP
jgi:hypothetical protein